jgi:Ca-activated chloride channel family protein
MKKLVYVLTVLLISFISCDEKDTLTTDYGNYPYYSYSNNYASEDECNDYTGGDRYNVFMENPFIYTSEQPVSTFSIDADGGSYSNVKDFIQNGEFPPAEAVRTEEFINYFNYNYPDPEGDHKISVNSEICSCPWNESNKLLSIGIKGTKIPNELLPPSNLVLLIDVSGSMTPDNKLPLLKESFQMLVDEFRKQDRIAIVTYAGSAGVALESTSGENKNMIKNVINSLHAGGSTAGAQGIVTAYEIAEQNYIDGGNNRIILATDGDFNVGISNQDALVELIESKRDKGIFITIIGVGRGNLNDAMMEQVANNGNGTYEYLGNYTDAKKILVDEYGKFFTIAKDVKIQITFYEETVEQYRLIGYENRVMDNEDFEDDEEDAGEIGLGQSITALYEIIPVQSSDSNNEICNIDFRYKKSGGNQSILINIKGKDKGNTFLNASADMRFAASVAGVSLLLRNSEYKGDLTIQDIYEWANESKSYDPFGYKSDFIELVSSVMEMTDLIFIHSENYKN